MQSLADKLKQAGLINQKDIDRVARIKRAEAAQEKIRNMHKQNRLKKELNEKEKKAVAQALIDLNEVMTNAFFEKIRKIF